MDETLIAKWNAIVPVNGYVFHLGDVGLCSTVHLSHILKRLNGRIILIRGNHEKPAMANSSRFELIKDVYTLKLPNQSIFMSHYAHRVWNKSHHGVWHLYGHSHGTLEDLPNSCSFDIGVDCHNFSPLTYAQVGEIMQRKTWKPLDHHQ